MVSLSAAQKRWPAALAAGRLDAPRYLPLLAPPAVAASSMKSAARSAATVKTAVAVESAIPADTRVSMKAAVPAAGSSVAMEPSVRPAEVPIPVEALDAFTAAKSGRSVKVSIAVKAAKFFPAVDHRSAVEIPAAEVPPATATNAEVAPPVASMEIAPPVMIVEIDPCRVVKSESSAVERRSIEPVEPRARTDKQPAVKPFRPVIAIRSAGIRCV